MRTLKIETYAYKLVPPKSYLLLVLCGIVAVGAGFLALTNDAGLMVAGLNLGVKGATLAYSGVAAIAGAVAFEELREVLKPKVQVSKIILDEEALVAPARIDNPQMLRLPYKGITDVKSLDRDGVRFLEVKHMVGNVHICCPAMENQDAFNQLWRNLESRIGLHRGYRY